MDAAEIEIYITKLSEVELALSADPTNKELAQLKHEIEDLLALSSQLRETPSTPLAKASKDDGAGKRQARPDNKKAVVQKGKVAKKDNVSEGQQAWLKFAKSGKKLKAKAINKQSIFKSPDTVAGKVGVANSGRGMTRNPSAKKHSVDS
ncbi:hypothetical protein GGI25_002659 [Coemansia spiralis]|uniref:Tudor domain-containing protein n=2 Tax=Coemansia TaxID=4863 RepID=A0A9W8G8H6_9FUNG|nr:hypothetical protein BX070DRAFT_235528 [Coemansia spiralis]KAJ1992903.1 hypothetical protein EDC05_002535 [Coemansia umbellata]KAJ2622837.1 hypothetical protein GGI26_002944 [Coemansia sp. RSA 1358]KAJ2678016.1 hypothetical protein GGI25_002659 [Coemansia spiralis]